MNVNRHIPDVVALTRELVSMDTTLHDGNERAALECIAAKLEPFGFSCSMIGYDPDDAGKANLVAQLNPSSTRPELCLCGHIDTVPFGSAPWEEDPLAATMKDGRLAGRGSVDMKGGLAAMICAALAISGQTGGRNLILHIYGSEEVGMRGSRHLSAKRPDMMGTVGAVLIGEPTGNHLQVGHKGILWIRCVARGVTAHAAMPEKGKNALLKLLPAAVNLALYVPDACHEYLGASTAVLATLHAGLNTNSVPDKAEMTLDVRTVAGQDTAAVIQTVTRLAGDEVEVFVDVEVPPLWTDPELPWCGRVRDIVKGVTGVEADVETARFATDGANMRAALPDAPILILGPGDPRMAHSTNECVPLTALRQAQALYEAILADWYGLG